MNNSNEYISMLKSLSIENQAKAINKLINYLDEKDNQDNSITPAVFPCSKN